MGFAFTFWYVRGLYTMGPSLKHISRNEGRLMASINRIFATQGDKAGFV